MKNLTELNIKNKKVLMRVDYNVPIKNGRIQSEFRLEATKKTIQYCLDKDASIILMSHLGRPNGVDPGLSLKIIINYLKETFQTNVYFSNDCISSNAHSISSKLKSREIHLLENLRYYKEEINNDKDFAKKLSLHGNIYINEAFGISHREHASNSSILKYFKVKSFGFLMMNEITCLSNIKVENKSSCVIVLGGAKVSTKLKMIKNFINKSSFILIGGAMAFTFLKAMGYEVGKSLVEENMLNDAKNILEKSIKNNVKVILPIDVVCSTKLSDKTKFHVRFIDEIKSNEIGLDIGPESVLTFEMILKNAKVIIWNGPLGAFEFNNYSTGTHAIAHCISRLTKENKIKSIIGGGDTASAVINYKLESQFSHVSTGGGASLQLLSGEKLKIISSWKKYE